MKWDNFTFIDLFAGIGGIRLAFEEFGGTCVFSSEWDEKACQTYEANFHEKPAGDITRIDAKEIPDFDILLAGFPCQPFSIIGDQAGFAHETQGTLFFDIERILKEKKPQAFLLENVRNLTTHDKGRTFRVIIEHLEALGYTVYHRVLNALDYGVPQKRERIIIVGFLKEFPFRFPDPVPVKQRKKLKDILEKDSEVDRSLYVRDEIRTRRNARMFEKIKQEPKRPYITHENVAGMITPHEYSCALRAGASANYLLVNNERRPSARELLRLQGFPDTFQIVVSYSAIKKQTGNSVAVPVIRAVAGQMIKTLKRYDEENRLTREEAKQALDQLIGKSRVHLYKPIQIAEILYQKRLHPEMDLLDLESYRAKSRKWRDDISVELLGRKCTSSARFQDNLFDANAIPPEVLYELGEENCAGNGVVEAYIYSRFTQKHSQLSQALELCTAATVETFDVKQFIDSFWNQPGLKRSLDKIYEIVVYALFYVIIRELKMTVEISVDAEKFDVLREFEDFARKIMCIDIEHPVYRQDAKIYRVGVTNAADRGFDMYSNWGPAIQIKHLALDEELANSIVDSIQSDRIVIVCKSAERGIIVSLLNQLGWKSRIQSIITEDDMIQWYEKALRGKYSEVLGQKLLDTLAEEITEEFPSVGNVGSSIKKRHYERITDEFWR